MKTYIFTLLLVLFATGSGLRAQDQYESLGLPGDNLNLFAVMKLFQESETLEGFERSLNDEKTHINNLDLDGDQRIDYIRVIDHPDGNFHTIVLQVAVSPRENQDVAVFTVQRLSEGRVEIQLTGDEALYGRDYIVEPYYGDLESRGETPNPGYTRVVGGETIVVNRYTTYDIAAWPVIHYIYLPTYSVWYSPWYYGYYPSYWHPWRPYYWHAYYGYHYHYDPYYYGNFRRWNYHRDNYWQSSYYGQRRSYSPHVYSNIQGGTYKRTYSRPETRDEGSRIYYRSHPEQTSRRSDINTRSNDVNRRSTATSPDRRSIETNTRRSGETTATQRSTGTTTTRRSTVTSPDTQSGNTRTGRRGGATVTTQTRPATEMKTTAESGRQQERVQTSRRSSESGSGRVEQNMQNRRQSGTTQSPSVRRAERKSSNNQPAATENSSSRRGGKRTTE